MYVNYEVPTGTINSVNTIFTLLNTPDTTQPLNLWMDGAIYRGFNIVGTTLTLTDAPISSLYISYATSPLNPDTESQDTLLDIIEEVWDLLGQTSNSTVFSKAKVTKKINSRIKEVCRGRVTSLLDTNRIYRAGKLEFLEADTSYRIKSGATITTEANIGDTVIECDTTYLNPAGYVQVGKDVVNYTSKTTTQIEGVSGITVTHNVGDKIEQLYQLPVNYSRINNVKKIIQGEGLREVEIPFDPTESLGYCYNIYQSGTTTLVKVIGLENDDLININYQIKIYDLVDDADECIIPDTYGTKVIAPLVAGEYAMQKTIPTYQGILLSGYTALQNMFQYFTNTTNVIQQSIKPKAYSFRGIRR